MTSFIWTITYVVDAILKVVVDLYEKRNFKIYFHVHIDVLIKKKL